MPDLLRILFRDHNRVLLILLIRITTLNRNLSASKLSLDLALITNLFVREGRFSYTFNKLKSTRKLLISVIIIKARISFSSS